MQNLPPPLADYFALISTEIRDVNSTNVRSLVGNTIARTADIAIAVQPDSEITRALVAVQDAASSLARAINDFGFYGNHRAEIVQARELANIRLDDLRDRLLTSRPSDSARNLGFGW